MGAPLRVGAVVARVLSLLWKKPLIGKHIYNRNIIINVFKKNTVNKLLLFAILFLSYQPLILNYFFSFL